MASESRMRALRPFTNRVINRVTRLFAGRLPGLAMLTTVGRKSGRRYSIPINVFERDGSYVFALTYGSDVQWLKNVRVAGSCDMRTRGRDVRLTDPEVIEDPSRHLMPLPARLILRLNGVTMFVRMRPLDATTEAAGVTSRAGQQLQRVRRPTRVARSSHGRTTLGRLERLAAVPAVSLDRRATLDDL